MIYRWTDLEGVTLRGTDGEIGTVQDLLFDADRWRIRYAVVKTGDWFEGRRILVAPSDLRLEQVVDRNLPVSIARERVAASPVFDMEAGLTPEQVQSLHNYYGWPFYWEGEADNAPIGPQGFLASIPLIELSASIREQMPMEGLNDIGQTTQNPRLRSLNSMRGFSIRARDGEFGNVADFLFENEEWRIYYLVVDTGGWFGGRQVIVSPTWTEVVNWDQSQVSMDLKQETIAHSPEYDPNTPLTRDFETNLYDHYGKNRYWDERGGA